MHLEFLFERLTKRLRFHGVHQQLETRAKLESLYGETTGVFDGWIIGIDLVERLRLHESVNDDVLIRIAAQRDRSKRLPIENIHRALTSNSSTFVIENRLRPQLSAD